MSSLKASLTLSSRLSSSIGTIGEDRIKRYTENLQNTIGDLYTTMKHTLFWIKSHRDELVLKKEEINIAELLENVVNMIATINSVDLNQVDMEIDSSVLIHSDQQLLRSILHNIIDNELKHNQKTELKITAWESRNWVKLIISNSKHSINGLEEWNEYFSSKKANPPNAIKLEGGLGLVLVKELSDLLEIKVQLSRIDEVGYKFSLAIPFQKQSN